MSWVFQCYSKTYYILFCVKAPSFEASEAHRYQNNRLGIFRARGGCLLDHAYAPCHPASASPTGERQGSNSLTTGIGYDYFNRKLKTVCTVSQNNQTKHMLFWQNPVKITERFRDWPKIYSAVRQAKNIVWHRSEDPDSIISAIVDFIEKCYK